MKKKVLLTGILSIVMCLSLIVGATFALFTSESKVNIAVTSGNVKMTASIVENSLKITNANNPNYVSSDKFELGGGATFNTANAQLELNKMTAGDNVEFYIDVVNESTVDVCYRVAFIAEGDLLNNLTINATIGGNSYSVDNTLGLTSWVKIMANDSTNPLNDATNKEDIHINICLPVETVEMQQSATMSIKVEAIQGNAISANPTNETELRNALAYGGEVVIANNITVSGDSIEIPAGVVSKLNLNGFNVTASSSMSKSLFVNKGTFYIDGVEQSQGASLYALRSYATTYENANVTNTISVENVNANVSVIENQGTLEISGVKLVGANNADSVVIEAKENSKITVFEVEIKASAGDGIKVANSATAVIYQALFELNGENKSPIATESEAVVEIKGEIKLEGEGVTEDVVIPLPSGYELAVYNGTNYVVPVGSIVVGTAEELKALNDAWLVSGGDDNKITFVYLVADIDFSGKEWLPVDVHMDGNNAANFNGIMGNGYTISNLTVKGQAMFRRFANGKHIKIENLTIDGAIVNNGGINTSVFCGQSYCDVTFDNVVIKNSTITGGYKVAPFLATLYDESGNLTKTVTIKNCLSEANVVKSLSYDFCTTALVSFVYAGDGERIIFEGTTVIKDNKLYAARAYTAHAWIYTTGSETLFDVAEGVKTENNTFENI